MFADGFDQTQVFSFDAPHDFGPMTNTWGHTDWTPGQITVTTVEGEWLDAGAMAAGEGWGYGKFEFDVAVRSAVVGPYALLWPASGEHAEDDVWPGPEMNVFELHTTGSDMHRAGTYSATHWDKDIWQNVNEDDGHTINWNMPQSDPVMLHTYSVDWKPGELIFAVDGVEYATERAHVPKDAAHGGINMLPSIGIHLWPEIVEFQRTDNAITLTELRITPWKAR